MQAKIIGIVSRYPITIEPSTAVLAEKIKVFETARTHHLTIYDAAYLELSVRLGGVPLITYDKELLAIARKLKIKTNI
jgi:predicted nucleic acid-binding protein